MTIYRPSIKIRCDECHDDYPSDFNQGVMTWVFARIRGEPEEQHFCSQYCFDFFKNATHGVIVEAKRLIRTDSEEFKLILQKAEQEIR